MEISFGSSAEHSFPASANQDSPVANHAPRKARRQKVAVACDQCRSKKTKCNGRHPVCGPCAARPESSRRCTWLHTSIKSSSQASREHISRLERRIQELESSHTISGASPTSPSRRSNASPLPQESFSISEAVPTATIHHVEEGAVPGEKSSNLLPPASGVVYRSPVNAQSSPGQSATNASSGSLQTPSASSARSRGLTSAMIGPTSDTAEANALYGSSSAATFTAEVRRAVEKRLGSSKPHNANIPEQMFLIGPSTAPFGDQEPIEYALPSRRRADALFSLYWKSVHPLYPFLDKPETIRCYETLWTGAEHPDNNSSFFCMINVIFALCCQLNVTLSAKERQTSAQTFFNRARGSLDPWKACTIQTVQLYLITAQYLQSTDELHQCWMFVGLAVRTAQSIGLHLTDSSTPTTSRRHEMTVRVWSGCILMDRFLAMTYGWPSMIMRPVARRSPLPSPLDEENFESNHRSEPNPHPKPSLIDFFVQSAKLYGIMNDFLGGCFPQRKRQETPSACEDYFGISTSSPESPSLLEVDYRLRQWEGSLPPHLRVTTRNILDRNLGMIHDDNMIAIRQAVVLRQRYLHVKLLSLRPILSRFVAAETNESPEQTALGDTLSRRLARECSITCVKIAQEAIQLVQDNRETDWATTGLSSAWWYNAFFVYSAATVLIAARLRDSLTVELGQESILDSWRAAIRVLESYSSFGESIPRLIATLQVLFDQVPAVYSHAGQESTNHEFVQRPDGGRHQLPRARPDHEGTFNSHHYSVGLQSNLMEDVHFSEGFNPEELLASIQDPAFYQDDYAWLNTVPFAWS